MQSGRLKGRAGGWRYYGNKRSHRKAGNTWPDYYGNKPATMGQPDALMDW